MASTDDETEQLLASKQATPIARLAPDLADPATRKAHGEVTVTWPYNALTKRLAFLLAEPDVRLRRDKGLVRIQLSGPSAEAVAKWELGSGDDVTVALDGVDWAKDDEPARPPGSRLQWQLKYAGKLVLKAALGETQETKYLHIDVPAPVETSGPFESLAIAEMETDTPEPALTNAPAPRPPITNEYASPIFAKRSRASYGPLFELVDQELEEDGGRRGKGRKRPRYSVEGGKWRYREGSSSPELDPPTEAPSAPEQSIKQTSPPKPMMADGGCQTNDFDLPPPPPSGSFNTPLKRWGDAENSPLFAVGMARAAAGPRLDMGVQALPSVPNALASEPHHNTALAPDTTSTLGMAASYPNLFGTPRQADRPFGQAASSFATAQTPTQPPFSQPTHAGTPFGGGGGGGNSPSVGFRFGQPPPPSTANASLFAQPQEPVQPHGGHNAYPESYLAHDAPTDLAPTTSHNPFSAEARSPLYGIGDAQESHASSYWTTTASADPIQRQGLPDPVDAGHSDESMRENTPPGTIPSHVEDGTRNQDEMKQEGLLSRSVYRQGVPEQALPDQGNASAGDEDDSMDSDEQADYDENEKGDDYDLRNYDPVSDDEEGYEEGEEPLSDEALLEEEEEDEEEYDDDDDVEGDDYDEDEEDAYGGRRQALKAPRSFLPRQAPQPAPPNVSKEPVYIDLLSDTDDDEPPAPQPARTQVQQPPPANPITSTPIQNATNPVHESQPLNTSEPEHETSEDEEGLESRKDARAYGLDGQVEEPDAEKEPDEDEDVSEEDVDEPGDVADEPDAGDEAEGIVSAERPQVNVVTTTTSTIAYGNEAAASSPVQHPQSDQSDDVEERVTVEAKSLVTEKEAVIEERRESFVESFQTQPAEMLASFETQTSEAAQSSEIGLEDAEDGVDEATLETEVQSEESVDLLEEEQEENVPEDKAREIEDQTEIESERQDLSSDGVDIPPPTAASGNDETSPVAKVDASTTTTTTTTTVTTSHVETQLGDTPANTFETRETDDLGSSLPTTTEKDVVATVAEEQDTEMADTAPSPEGEDDPAEVDDDASSPFREDVDMADPEGPLLEAENDAGELEDAPFESNQDDDDDVMDTAASPEDGDVDVKGVSSNSPSPERDDIEDDAGQDDESVPPTPQQTSAQGSRASRSPESLPPQIDGTHSDEGDEFHDVSEALEAENFSPTLPYNDHSSFMTANSEVSEMPGSEGAEPTSTARRKRASRNDLSINFKRSRPAPFEMSPSRQRTTRSKAMIFQMLSSPTNNKEDMSIQLARAALKSPTNREAPAVKTTGNKLKTSLVKRLADEMPECVPLKDLKKYHNRSLDVAVVAASAATPPKRTPVREYVSSLVVTDPSLGPCEGGVVEVTIFSLHRDHLPVVKAGDSVLLRSFAVQALPGKGWGLKSDKNAASSWAVFEAGGEDGGDDKAAPPQMRAAPVELTDEEHKYLVDLRGWYAALDAGARETLGKAVGALVDKGREARGEKK